MAGEYILAIDQSTSGTKALLFDDLGNILCRSDKEHKQKISADGWVAHDPMEIYRNTLGATGDVIKKAEIDSGNIIGVGISNQRETALVWDRRTGLPIYDAVVWQCSRGAEICKRLSLHGDDIRAATGLPLSPYFSAAKIAWILEHTQNHNNQNLCAGTIDSWLLYKLTGNFKTDYSNASRTQLLNLSNLKWDEKICGLFGIAPSLLPEICDSNSCFGYTDFEGLLPRPVPVHGVIGDSHGALFGQGCLERGMGKVTYGTGSSVMINIGEEPVYCKNVVTSLAWGIDGKVNYVVEGNINYTGAVIKWLVEDLGLISSSKEAGKLAASANPQDTTVLVPAFSGLGAPHWVSEAKACFCGMTRNTGRAELVKAAEESIAFQITDVVKAIEEEAGIILSELRVDGGPTQDSFLMQFQSDMLNLPLSLPANEELSGIGAAYMAGIALGKYTYNKLRDTPRKYYKPLMQAELRESRYRAWQEAVRRTIQ
jgi:glycerol kinase